ncbi:MAG: lytic transglycosylase domain-containing protein [Methylohalobius crimeensis]
MVRHRSLWLGIVLVAMPAAADVYKYVDTNGQVYYADERKHAGYRLIIRSPRPGRSGGQWTLRRAKYAPLVEKVAKKYRLDPQLLHAVIRAESAYNPQAISPKGAVGLMQLMPDTAARYGIQDRYDPFKNIEAGAHYLRDLLADFKDVKLAVAAYNAGEAAVHKYGNRVPPYLETRQYVARVLKFYGDS